MEANSLAYVINRLNHAHIEKCAAQAVRCWDGGDVAFEVCYQPDDGTHYDLMFLVLGRSVRQLGESVSGGAPYTAMGGRWDGQQALVYSAQQGRGFTMGRTEFVAPAYVDEKLDYGPASSLAVAILLNKITGAVPGWEERMLANAREAELAEAQ